MKIEDRKIIVDHIIDKQFTPALMRKVMPFVDELVEKRMAVIDYAQHIGYPIAMPQTTLDLRPEFEELSRKICLLMQKTND